MAQALTAPLRGPDSATPGGAPATAAHEAWGLETGVLRLKSQPAPLRPGLVPRERLVRRLVEARDVPLALIVAPAGYGKTTLLSEWAERDGRPFAWVRLDAADNDPRTLLAAVALALDVVEPVGWDVFDALTSGRPDSTTVALGRLARSLSRRRPPAVLALDDLHVIRTPESRHLVNALSQACGPPLQLAIASRGDVVLPVARLRAQGNAIELRTPDLAMTRSEASALLRLAGVELAPERALALARSTEGWPAALYLAALSLSEQRQDPEPAELGGGEDRLVGDYVREEVLSGLPPAQLEFLTRTSVLETLTAPLCDAVLGRRDSADMLARLARSNVLLAPLDRGHTAYRYHELFAGVLRAELRRREPGRDAELHSRASSWCAANGDADRAIGHAIEGHDLELAGRLLWAGAPEHATGAVQRPICDWLDRFGDEELADAPLLALAAASAALAAGSLEAAERFTSLADMRSDHTNEEEAALALMRASLGRSGVAAMGEDAARAHELLDERSPWRPLCRLLQGVAQHLLGSPGEARGLLEAGAHRAAASAPIVQALCQAQLALLAADDDDPERACALAARARAQIDRCGLDRCPPVALVLAVSAEQRARRGQLGEATGELRRARELLARITDPSRWYEAECRVVLGRAALLLNSPALAGELLAAAGRAQRQTGDAPMLRIWLDEALAVVDLAPGSSADWSLTAAELRVLGHLPSHLSLREIAARLHVSTNTVKSQARGIYRKLDVSSRGDAVDRARDSGLVGGAQPSRGSAPDHPIRMMSGGRRRPTLARTPTKGLAMGKPMFFFAGVYDDVAGADADYEAIKALHSGDAIGSYDAAIITRQPDGKVKVSKTEKPTQHGAWTGLAAGAGAAVIFPFLLPGLTIAGMAGAGAGLGAWFGHLAHGTSRGEAREIGALLEQGSAALVVVGVDRDVDRIELAATRAKHSVLKREFGDFEAAEQEALAAIEQAERVR